MRRTIKAFGKWRTWLEKLLDKLDSCRSMEQQPKLCLDTFPTTADHYLCQEGHHWPIQCQKTQHLSKLNTFSASTTTTSSGQHLLGKSSLKQLQLPTTDDACELWACHQPPTQQLLAEAQKGRTKNRRKRRQIRSLFLSEEDTIWINIKTSSEIAWSRWSYMYLSSYKWLSIVHDVT